MIRTLDLAVGGPGLHEITGPVAAAVAEMLDEMENAGVSNGGLCTLFIRHTSASLTIQENADPSARRDLERFLARLVPENDPLYTHTAEGPDDMPSHIRAALTATSLSIPILNGRLGLGTWQGIFLWEHRRGRRERQLLVHVGG
ncbi:MAG TPA: secondary thiamine-phosphate synthase enzyme YjbQ [Thermoanaerobaculia bacterium]|nr:secondary thiamine-phosphate synthase enzyme YjbQ [Thermoanaerobaculia bacterium]